MESLAETIENQLLIIIQKYEHLKIEYEKNREILNRLATPKIGQKRKRYQML
jgi:hypothetical protein